MRMVSRRSRGVVLTAVAWLLVLAGCGGTVGEAREEAEATTDDVVDDDAVAGAAGCVACHTDKERLMVLAPKVEGEEPEGGGG